VRESGKETDK